jgi:hypothetical protein
MDIPPGYAAEVVPRGFPPPELVPEAVRAVAEGVPDELNRRSLLWTAAIFSELRYWRERGDRPPEAVGPSGQRAPWPPLMQLLEMLPRDSVAVGLLDPKFEVAGFGLVVHLTGGEPRMLFAGNVRLPRLEPTFPLVVGRYWEDLHQTPNVHPTNGRSTCWAQSNITGQCGILTAKHCANGIPVRGSMALTPNGHGTVVAKGQYVIDAAFVATPNASVTGRAALAAVSFPVGGAPATINLGTGTIPATIVRVTDTLGVLDDFNHPVKVYLDKYGSPGDSGGLVDTPSNDGVGIYCGTLSNATVAGVSGVTVGVCQHLKQAALVLDLSLYQ